MRLAAFLLVEEDRRELYLAEGLREIEKRRARQMAQTMEASGFILL